MYASQNRTTPTTAPKRLPYQRYKLHIQYDGASFEGWQAQIHKDRKESVTVQSVLEKIVNERIVGAVYEKLHKQQKQRQKEHQLATEPNSDNISNEFEFEFERHKYVNVIGSSRTDSGVHAIHTTAHMDLCKLNPKTGQPILLNNNNNNNTYVLGDSGAVPEDPNRFEQYDCETLLKSLNYYLSKDHPGLCILAVEKKDADYHSRRNARRRTYMYRIIVNCPVEVPMLRNKVWFLNTNMTKCIATGAKQQQRQQQRQQAPLLLDLDIEAMRRGAEYFKGTHDFTCFCSSLKRGGGLSPIKTIESFAVTVTRDIFEQSNNTSMAFLPTALPQFSSAFEVRLFVSSKAFLYHQVRLMVHALVLVGLKVIEPEKIRDLLLEKSRVELTQYMAPAEGLYLYRVEDKNDIIMDSEVLETSGGGGGGSNDSSSVEDDEEEEEEDGGA